MALWNRGRLHGGRLGLLAVAMSVSACAPMQSVATSSACPVTIANQSTPPGEAWGPNYHGNGQLWTTLWPDGIVQTKPDELQDDGSIGLKWPWVRGVVGQLQIEGERVDGPSPPLRARIPDGYGVSGFQSTALYFPTAGCWKVIGRVGDAKLAFITMIPAPPKPISSDD
jgi:hypothetical protein